MFSIYVTLHYSFNNVKCDFGHIRNFKEFARSNQDKGISVSIPNFQEGGLIGMVQEANQIVSIWLDRKGTLFLPSSIRI